MVDSKWNLYSLSDPRLGSPLSILRDLNSSPMYVYPWPTQGMDQQGFSSERASILLSLGMLPPPIVPNYTSRAREVYKVYFP